MDVTSTSAYQEYRLLVRNWSNLRLRWVDYFGRTAYRKGRRPNMAKLHAARDERRDRGHAVVGLTA